MRGYPSDDVVERSETPLELCGTDAGFGSSVDLSEANVELLSGILEAEIEERVGASSTDANIGAAWRAFSKLSRGSVSACGEIGLLGLDFWLLDRLRAPKILEAEES